MFLWPLLTQALLNRFAWPGALMVQSGLILNGLVCGALFRPPEEKLFVSRPTIDESTLEGNKISKKLKSVCSKSHSAFMVYLAGYFGLTMGDACMVVYIVLKGHSEHISKYESSILPSIIGIIGLVGRPTFGCIGGLKKVNRTVMVGLNGIAYGVLNMIVPAMTRFPLLVVTCALSGIFCSKYIFFLLLIWPFRLN